jgi:sigma54-dependent transcription regulator
MEELRHSWRTAGASTTGKLAAKRVPRWKETETIIPQKLLPHLHRADKLALEEIMKLCRKGGSLRDAGRMLYAAPLDTKGKNYSDLVRKFIDHCTAKIPGSRFVLERGKGLVLKQTSDSTGGDNAH